jgi:hypothetical protein
MMEKETQALLNAAKAAAETLHHEGYNLTGNALDQAIADFEAAQDKHPEHVMFLKADDGARTR